MNEPNKYVQDEVDGADLMNRVLTDVLKDALDLRDVNRGWNMILAQLDFYGLCRGSQEETDMLEDYASGVLGNFDELDPDIRWGDEK